MLMGIGGTPEGVISAAALKCVGGALQGRLWPRNDEERQALVDAGLRPRPRADDRRPRRRRRRLRRRDGRHDRRAAARRPLHARTARSPTRSSCARAPAPSAASRPSTRSRSSRASPVASTANSCRPRGGIPAPPGHGPQAVTIGGAWTARHAQNAPRHRGRGPRAARAGAGGHVAGVRCADADRQVDVVRAVLFDGRG